MGRWLVTTQDGAAVMFINEGRAREAAAEFASVYRIEAWLFRYDDDRPGLDLWATYTPGAERDECSISEEPHLTAA